jgi:hypothetical protein
MANWSLTKLNSLRAQPPMKLQPSNQDDVVRKLVMGPRRDSDSNIVCPITQLKSITSNTPGWHRILIGVAMVRKTFPST